MNPECQSARLDKLGVGTGQPLALSPHSTSEKIGKVKNQTQRLISNISGAAKSATVSSTSFLVSALSRGIKGTKNGFLGLVNSYPLHSSISQPNIHSFNAPIPSPIDLPESFPDEDHHGMRIYFSFLDSSLSYNLESQDFPSNHLEIPGDSRNPLRNTLSYFKSEHDWPDRPRSVAPIAQLKVLLPFNPSKYGTSLSSLTEQSAPLKFDLLVIKAKKSKRNRPQDYQQHRTDLFHDPLPSPEPSFYIWHLKADNSEQSYQWISILSRLSSKTSSPLVTARQFSHPLSSNPPLSPIAMSQFSDWDKLMKEVISYTDTIMIKSPPSTTAIFSILKEKLSLLNALRNEELRLLFEQLSSLKEKLRWLALQSIQSIPDDFQPDEGKTELEEETEKNSIFENGSSSSSYDVADSESDDDLFYECENYHLIPSSGKTNRKPVADPNSDLGYSMVNIADEPNIIDIPQQEVPPLEVQTRTQFEYSMLRSAVGYPMAPRTTLPTVASVDLSTVSIWSVLRQAIGKDLSRLCVPIQFNEPLSMLQRVSEDLEYWTLLEKAVAEPNAQIRLLLVSAFACAVYSSTWDGRLGKPFNPLLNETFELVYRDPNSTERVAFRYISEQVSHHPPISASYSEGYGWVLESETRVKISFWGKCISLIPAGSNRLVLTLPSGDKEVYSWKRITSSIHNIFMGKMRIDHSGEMDIICHTTGFYTRLVFMSDSIHSNNPDAPNVRGHLFQPHRDTDPHHHKNAPIYIIEGSWFHSLWAYPRGDNSSLPDPSKRIMIWQATERPSCSASMFHFTSFAMGLNELTPEMALVLAPTDSRFRKDQRALEEGRLTEGVEFKEILEKRQRKRRGASTPQQPIWFAKNAVRDYDEIDHIFPVAWRYLGGYWETRERHVRRLEALREFEKKIEQPKIVSRASLPNSGNGDNNADDGDGGDLKGYTPVTAGVALPITSRGVSELPQDLALKLDIKAVDPSEWASLPQIFPDQYELAELC